MVCYYGRIGHWQAHLARTQAVAARRFSRSTRDLSAGHSKVTVYGSMVLCVSTLSCHDREAGSIPVRAALGKKPDIGWPGLA